MNLLWIFKHVCLLVASISILTLSLANAQLSPSSVDLRLGSGDLIRVQVFQNPDLSIEARVSASGVISYPLLGSIQLGGLSIGAAEKKIADGLQVGGFVKQPQVNIVLVQVRGSQVSVLGQVTKPGQFPLETSGMRVTDLIAMAGGATAAGADIAIVTGMRDGKTFRKEIDIPALFIAESTADNMQVEAGDSIFIPRAPLFYIYGEAQRPGSYRIERGMTVIQALAAGGGPTSRGSESRLRLRRRNANNEVIETTPSANDFVLPDDVIYVRESIF